MAKEEHSKAAKAVEKLGGEVFHTEDGLSYTTAVQKTQERKQKVKPLLDEFYEFISKIKKPIGRLKIAINYVLSQKQRVYQILITERCHWIIITMSSKSGQLQLGGRTISSQRVKWAPRLTQCGIASFKPLN